MISAACHVVRGFKAGFSPTGRLSRPHEASAIVRASQYDVTTTGASSLRVTFAVFFFAFVFMLFFVVILFVFFWLFSNEDVGSYQAIRRV